MIGMNGPNLKYVNFKLNHGSINFILQGHIISITLFVWSSNARFLIFKTYIVRPIFHFDNVNEFFGHPYDIYFTKIRSSFNNSSFAKENFVISSSIFISTLRTFFHTSFIAHSSS